MLKTLLGGGAKTSTSVAAGATREQLLAEFPGEENAEFVAECLAKKLGVGEAWKAKAQASDAVLAKIGKTEPSMEEIEMPAAPVVATADELDAEFPDDPKFVLEMIKAKASMQDAWKAKARKNQEALAKAQESARRVGEAGRGGHTGVSASQQREHGGAGGGTATASRPAPSLPFATGDDHPFMHEVRRVQRADGIVYGAAVNKVIAERPDLHEAYVRDKGQATAARR